MTIKVRMLRTEHGSPGHITTKAYDEGKEYDLPELLAKAFVEDVKCAEYVTGRRREVDHTAPPAVDKKMAPAAPENKSAAPAEAKEGPVVVPARPVARASART